MRCRHGVRLRIDEQGRRNGHGYYHRTHEDNLCNGSSGSHWVMGRARRSISSPLSVLSSAGSSCEDQRPSGALRLTSKAYSDSFFNATNPPRIARTHTAHTCLTLCSCISIPWVRIEWVEHYYDIQTAVLCLHISNRKLIRNRWRSWVWSRRSAVDAVLVVSPHPDHQTKGIRSKFGFAASWINVHQVLIHQTH